MTNARKSLNAHHYIISGSFREKAPYAGVALAIVG